MSFADKVKTQSRETLLQAIRGALATSPDTTLGTVLADLESDAAYKDAFLSVTAAELSQWFSVSAEKPKRARAESTDKPVENWEASKAGHIAKVLEFLTARGLGEGDHARGFSPADLRKELGGTEVQMREVLKALEEQGAVGFAGDTKGKRYVIAALLPQAVSAHEAAKAAKAKADAEKAARAAQAKAEGKTPRGGKAKA